MTQESLKMKNSKYWDNEDLRGKYHPSGCKSIESSLIPSSHIPISKLADFSSQVVLQSVHFSPPG